MGGSELGWAERERVSLRGTWGSSSEAREERTEVVGVARDDHPQVRLGAVLGYVLSAEHLAGRLGEEEASGGAVRSKEMPRE